MAHEWIGLLLLASAAPLSAAEHEQTVKQGSTCLTLQWKPATVPLSSHLELTVTVEGPEPLVVELPDPLAGPGDAWHITELGPAQTTALSDQRLRWRQAFRLEPYSAGEVSLQIGPLRFRSGRSARWQEQTWKPITVQVTTDVDDPSLKSLRDITPIEQVPEAPAGFPYVLALSSVGAVLVLLAFVVWRLRRPPAAVPEQTPTEWAMRELERIEALDLPTAGAVERFHVLVSDALRQFLEKRLGLHATGQTTAEFLHELRRSAQLALEQQELLRKFLEQCDLAKFARAEFTAAECQGLLRTARNLIEHGRTSEVERHGATS